MSVGIFQWVVVVGIVVICIALVSVANHLRSLNHKVEYWGKVLSGSADDMRGNLSEIMADTSSVHRDVSDIAKRAAERFPTVKEIEHARHNQP